MITAIGGVLVGFVLALWVALVLSNAELDAAHRRADQAEAERDRLTRQNATLSLLVDVERSVAARATVDALIRSTGGRL
jgi:hypothetical protein